jgi:hypothetical protein
MFDPLVGIQTEQALAALRVDDEPGQFVAFDFLFVRRRVRGENSIRPYASGR